MEMDGLDADDVYMLRLFKPSPKDAVTYFLPRLIASLPLHGAKELIRHADVYAGEPEDLAARFVPVSSGDRFFFTTCKRKNGSGTHNARVAGSGTWTIQKTENIYHVGVKAGEVKHVSFKKGKAYTGWVMEEYRCLLPEAIVADGEKVLCKIHLAPHRQEQAEQPVPEIKTLAVTYFLLRLRGAARRRESHSPRRRLRLRVPRSRRPARAPAACREHRRPLLLHDVQAQERERQPHRAHRRLRLMWADHDNVHG